MASNFFTTLYSFYSHNAPLIFYGLIITILFIKLLIKPTRFTSLLLLGFGILLFNFEYDKHLFAQIKSHWLDLVFPEGTRFTKYNFARVFLEKMLPIVLDIAGWGIIVFTFLFVKKENEEEK